MYLGQATFYQDRLNEFLNVAKTLEVKEINKDVDYDEVDETQDQKFGENIIPESNEYSNMFVVTLHDWTFQVFGTTRTALDHFFCLQFFAAYN